MPAEPTYTVKEIMDILKAQGVVIARETVHQAARHYHWGRAGRGLFFRNVGQPSPNEYIRLRLKTSEKFPDLPHRHLVESD